MVRNAEDRLVLRCINHGFHVEESHGTPPETTMLSAPGWVSLMTVFPSSPAARRFYAPMYTPTFDASSGVPVKCCVCSVCGYVELYHGPIADPAVWAEKHDELVDRVLSKAEGSE